MRRLLGVALGAFAYLVASATGPGESRVHAISQLLISEAQAASVGREAAINGSSYAVIAPLFDGNSGTVSYIRLFNGASTTSTFSITVIDADTGASIGSTAQIQVPAYASPQYPLTSVGFSPPGITPIFTLAGVTDSPSTNYALYIQNGSQQAGYQHVTFNNTSQLFINNSNCKTILNQQLINTGATGNGLVLTNVHTSALGGGTAFPSVILIHNYFTTSLSYQISVYDAQNGGSPITQFNQIIGADETMSIAESTIESLHNFHPSSTQYQVNVFIADDNNGSAPTDILSHQITTTQLGGVVDMSTACAVNSSSSGNGSGSGGSGSGGSGSGGSGTGSSGGSNSQYALNVVRGGTGLGSVVATPSSAIQSTTSGISGSSNSGFGVAYYITPGAAVTLTATPASGSTFQGWGGACSGTGTCNVTMNSDQGVTANFGGSGGNPSASVTLATSYNGGANGSVVSSPAGINFSGQPSAGLSGQAQAFFTGGATVVLTATPATGSTFQGWGGACSGTGTCTLIAGSAQAVTASFSAGGSFIANATAGTVFPLIANQTIRAFTITNGAAVVAGTASLPTGSVVTNPTGSITQTATGFNFTLPDGKIVDYVLTAGASDIAGTGDYQAGTTDGTESVEVKLTNENASTLSYSTYGAWEEYNDPAGDYPITAGTMAAGIATTAATMPTTGTATYSGNIAGFGQNSTAFGNIKSGTVSLSVNFAANTITGTVSNIVTKGTGSNGAAGTMSNINLTGTISGTGFTMTATGVSAAATVNIGGASGTFSGSFSGPNAAEIAAVLGMTGGGVMLQAAFGAIQ